VPRPVPQLFARLYMMKRLGSLFMGAGLVVGIALGVGVIAGINVGGVPLLVAIGLGKLTFAAALGMMGAGAVLRRLALRRDQREPMSLPRPNAETKPTAPG